MDLIRNLFWFCCLRNAFSSHLCYRYWQLFSWFLFLTSTFQSFYLMASFRHFYFLKIYKNQSFILRKYSVNKFQILLLTGYSLFWLPVTNSFKCSTGQLIECWSFFWIFFVWIPRLLESFLFGFLIFDLFVLILKDYL